MAKMCLFHIARSLKKIPNNLRLCNTFFTHCTVVGTFEEIDGEIPPHFDEKDHISVVFHCGHVKNGGETVYYDGVSKKNWKSCIFCSIRTW